MAQRIRRHLSFANVASLMALVFAMGGTSYALTIPRNSVGSPQIKSSGVAASDLRNGAVTSPKVRDGSLLTRDFAAGQLPAGRPGPTGAMGATGPVGATGATGAQGLTGTVGAITVQRKDFSVPNTGVAQGLQVECPAGTKVIGGGASLEQTGATDVNLTVSQPFRTDPGVDGNDPEDGETFDSWRVTYVNAIGGSGDANAHAWATCAQT